MIRTLLNPVALVVLVGSLLLSGFLAGEEGTKIEGANGKPPNAMLVLDKDNGNPRPLWVAVENVVPRIKPDETSSQTDAKIPGYLDVIFFPKIGRENTICWPGMDRRQGGTHWLGARSAPDHAGRHARKRHADLSQRAHC